MEHSKVVPKKISKVELNKVDLNKVNLSKIHLNKVDPSRVDQSKVVLNRRYIRKAKTEGEVSSKEHSLRGTQELVVSDLRSNYLEV